MPGCVPEWKRTWAAGFPRSRSSADCGGSSRTSRKMHVSTETIYQSLYVQSRGALRQELTRCLRTGRAVRRPSRKVGQRKNRIPNMVNIAERPPIASDRAVPGSWEGDLIIGARNLSAIGTLVERSSNFTMLVPTRGIQTRAGRTRVDPEDPTAARPAPPGVDLGPGPGDPGLGTGEDRHRHSGVLLRPALALAAWHQREHQRSAGVVPETWNVQIDITRPRPAVRDTRPG